MSASHRETILEETARIISHEHFDGDQYIMRLHSPQIANISLPGQFVHIRCGEALDMRRPISIMRVSADNGWVEILYKAIGKGTHLLAQQAIDQELPMLGPIGNPFPLSDQHTNRLLIGGGVGMPPMVFLADQLRHTNDNTFVILGSEVPFPFKTIPSKLMIPGVSSSTIATMPLMEDWNIGCRLASLQDYPGCHQGYVTELAQHWLNNLDQDALAKTEIYACGPHPMLEAVAKVARQYDIPAQLSLEEHMACAIGGCAGCAVPIHTENGIQMKRVCVDGPVFEAKAVFG